MTNNWIKSSEEKRIENIDYMIDRVNGYLAFESKRFYLALANAIVGDKDDIFKFYKDAHKFVEDLEQEYYGKNID